ncbi:N-acetylglucosamine-6-phosphate deacetylase [Helicovermis profundi]|uniref:N-acetylglucosamine-6-phosphate deacetylase n=1 Tax=Helicovermis profundi TaxID=3065157 RepID=A0AAU9EVF5_9FIRM|nr:N-acetylglucosamine-6-phosphate deacetylase [Clostridia bacterium S502]
MKAFINGKIILENQILDNKVLIFDSTIISIKDAAPKGCKIIDVEGNYISPGFIDIHIHGFKGYDVMDSSLESLENISKEIIKTGVTRYLATTMTMKLSKIIDSLEVIKVAINKNNYKGAKIMGAYLEGPFISKEYKGAQSEKYIRKPSWKDIDKYNDIIKIITLAVEEDDNFDFIKNNPGINLSIGHSNANYETALIAYKMGVKHCTHCFNAMTGLHHRKPGIVGACFSKKYETEFIADKIHINPAFLETFINIIGVDQGIIITDSIRAGGMEEGVYELGGQEVYVDKTSARLKSGVLAGSILTMDKAIKNINELTKLPLYDIIKMATLNPAKSIDKDSNYGVIEIGKLSDFVILNKNLDVVSTWIEGEKIF